MKILRLSLLPVVVGLALAIPESPAAAQQTGTLTGTVVDATSARPLESAQVYIPALNMGGLSNQQGRFLILNVPAGTHEVSVELIGYTPDTQEVTVQAGQTANVEFQLNSTALRLQELVVTGVAGETPKVKLPFTVEKVDFSDMQVPTPTAEGLIKGKVAGAKVVSGSGQPGSSSDIMLRGPTTLTGSQDPLIIVDGVITDNTLADISSLDVENIEIVKGAAGASLYGSRASNGVVQITTRRGTDLRIDQSRITLRTEMGTQDIEGTIPRNKNAHWFETDASGNILDVEGNIVTDPQNHKRDTGINIAETSFHDQTFPSEIPLYDHLEQFFNAGTYMSQFIAAEGRTGSTNYRASFTYQDEAGVIPDFNSGFQLKGFRLNLDHEVRDDVSISLSSYYARSDQEDLGGSPFYALAFVNPFVNLLERDESTIGEPHCPPQGCLVNVPDPFSEEENPLYSLELLEQQDDRSRFLGSANLSWSPTSWFSLDGNFSLDRSDRTDTNLTPRGYATEQSVSLGNVNKQQSIDNDLNASITAAFNKAFGDLTTRTRLRYLVEDQHSEFFQVSGSETQAFGVPVLDNAATYTGSSSISDVVSEGYFFISALDYQGKYIGDFLVRRDGSSLFGPDERWQTYYRASGAWRLAQEAWWPFDVLDEFKLRYSRGTAGGRPRFSAQYETYSVSSSGIFPVQLGNKQLKPELATEQELGLETLWWDKVYFRLTYAWNTVEDQLLNVPLLAPVGFTGQWQNAGTLDSNTLEATLEMSLIEEADMGWTTTVNFDRTRQWITDLNRASYRTGYFYIRPGEPVGTFYGDKWASTCDDLVEGADCSQYQVNDLGHLVYVGSGNSWRDGAGPDGILDTDDDLWGQNFTENDLTRGWGMPIKALDDEGNTFLRLGSTTPDFNLTWSNNFRWKNLNLYTLFDGEFGADVYNHTRQYAYRDQTSGDQVMVGLPDERKKPLGYHQALYNVNANSGWFVEDGTYVKLREASLRYTFSEDQIENWFGALGMQGLSINVIGRNLLTFTDYQGYDPEAGGNGGVGSSVLGRVDDFGYPNFRSLSAAMQVIF